MTSAILVFVVAAYGVAAAVPAAPAELGQHSAAYDQLPRRAAEPEDDLLRAIWPGLAEAAPPDETEERPRALPSLLAGALSEGDASEAKLARHVAEVFIGWAARSLPPPPGFRDAELPAPEAWVARQLPAALGEEARLIAAALAAATDEEATNHARSLVRQRFRRVAMLHDRDVLAWRRAELREGLPLFVAYRALIESAWAEAGETPDPREDASRLSPLATRLKGALEEALSRAAQGEPAAFTPEISGFSLALLLDRSRPGWPELLIERNTSLDVLLAGPPRHFGNQPVPPAGDAER
ncbi:MAG: hypothetical protein OEQ13_02660 [Acidobacteriota bacterium]|nr:hypothetical protein [Acidobacteriota bacterium]